MKTCFKCLNSLPLDAFYKHSQMGDGHLNKCKACTKKDVSEHRQANLEDIRQYDRMRASKPHRVALRKKAAKEWVVANPARRRAQNQVASALKAGKLIPTPCMVCGIKAEAHHPDYDRPLDVVWLCSPHHKQAHALTHKHK